MRLVPDNPRVRGFRTDVLTSRGYFASKNEDYMHLCILYHYGGSYSLIDDVGFYVFSMVKYAGWYSFLVFMHGFYYAVSGEV